MTYPRLYYKHRPKRLRVCTLPIHSLLHIADDIEAMGPVWCYWAFPMERFCSVLGRSNLNPCFPFVSLDCRVLEVAQLSQIKFIYNLFEALDLDDRKDRITNGTHYPGYSDLVFVWPKRVFRLDAGLTKKVPAYIGDLLGVDRKYVEQQIKHHEFLRWGKMQQTMEAQPGDMVSGFAMMPDTETPWRNATFVKVNSESRLGNKAQLTC